MSNTDPLDFSAFAVGGDDAAVPDFSESAVAPGLEKTLGLSPIPTKYLDEIKTSEGFSRRSKWDYKQHTNGFGTRAKFAGEVIDKDEAERRFQDEIGKAAKLVDDFAPGLPEGVRAALTSLTFNSGADWQRMGLGAAIRNGDFKDAGQRFNQYINVIHDNGHKEVLPGLVERRAKEYQWWFDHAGDDGTDTESPSQLAELLALPPEKRHDALLDQIEKTTGADLGAYRQKPEPDVGSAGSLDFSAFAVDPSGAGSKSKSNNPDLPDSEKGVFGDLWGILKPEERRPAGEAELATAKSQQALAKDFREGLAPALEQTRTAPQSALDWVAKYNPVGFALDKTIQLADYAAEAYEEKQGKRVKTAEDALAGKAPLPSKSASRSGVEGALNSAASIIPSAIEYFGQARGYGTQFGEKLAGREVKSKVEDDAAYKFGKGLDDWLDKQFPGDQARQQQFTQQVAQGIGSTVGFWGPGAVVKLLGAGEKGYMAAIALSGISVQSAEKFNEITKLINEGNATEQDRLINWLAGIPMGASEALPFAPTIGAGFKKTVGNRISSGIEQAVEEALQEGGQTFGENVAAKQTYDPNRNLLEGVPEGMAIGGITGGLFGAGLGKSDGAAPVLPAAAQDAPPTTPPPIPGQPGSQSSTAPGDQPPQPAVAPPAVPRPTSAASLDDRAVLKSQGWSDADIDEMGDEERAQAVLDAQDQTAPPKTKPKTAPVADRPSAEPVSDLTAQIEAMRAGERKGVYLSADNLANLNSEPKFVEQISKAIQAAGGAVISDGSGGAIIAATSEIARAAKTELARGADPQAVIGDLTGAGSGKPAGAAAVVQQKTPDGAVTRESLVTPDQVKATEQAFAVPGKTVETVSPEQAIQRREDQIAAERAVVAQGDGSRTAPVQIVAASDVDRAGTRVAEPTPAQAEAGNYAKGHVRFQGLPISIETPKGGTRRGYGPDGELAWEVPDMPVAYGYIRGSKGADGEQIDVFIGGSVDSDKVFLIDQVDADTSAFDEHKAVLGADTATEAADLYAGSFSDGKGLARIGGISEMSMAEFKAWAKGGEQTAPVSSSVSTAPDFSGQAVAPERMERPTRPDRYTGPELSAAEIDALVESWRYVQEVSRRGRPQSLAAFVIERGGLQDGAKEVRHIAGAAKERPGLVNAGGETLDDAALAAWEAGFFTGSERPDIAEFLNALQDDLQTGSVVRALDEDLLEDIRIASDLAQEIGDYGVTTNWFRTEESLREYFGQERPRAARQVEAAEETQTAAEKPAPGARADLVADEVPFDLPVKAAPTEDDDSPTDEPLSDEEIETVVKAWRYVKAIDDQVQAGKAVPDAKLDKANELDADLADYGVSIEDLPDEDSIREYLGGSREPVAEKFTRPEEAQTPTSETEAVAEPQPAQAFNPYAFSVQVAFAREGADGLRKKLAPLSAVQLKQIATAQNLPIASDVIESGTKKVLSDAIIKAAQDRLANRMAAGGGTVEGANPAPASKTEQPYELAKDPKAFEEYVKGGDAKDLADAENWWRNELTAAGRTLAVQDAGLKSPVAKTAWQHLSAENRSALVKTYVEKYRALTNAGEEKTDVDWNFEPNSGWRDHLIRARVYAAGLGINHRGMELPEIVEAIDRKLSDHQGVPEGVTVRLSDYTLDEPEAHIKGGKYKAIAQRETPWAVVDGYGNTPDDARSVALQRLLKKIEPQTSLVPEATTKEKIAAEAKAKERKGGNESLDVGLFGSDKDQTDLVDMAKEPAKAEESTGRTEESAPAVTGLDALRDRLLGDGFKTIVEARKFAKDHGIDGTNKEIDEAIETAVVAAARDRIEQRQNNGAKVFEIYRSLIKLYDNQPNLAVRTSTSVTNQAYSTPMPLAYLASRLAGVQAADSVFEPTAGNGALLIESDVNKVVANEIEPGRAAALRDQGFATVKSVDATGDDVALAKSADSVIMNPPFGAVRENGQSKTWTINDFTTTSVDHAIALNALKAMTDDGRAVLIIGGIKAESIEERRAGYRAQGKRKFFAKLYKTYNVTDHFTVSGDLYKKQGAGWPVDVVVIEGRGTSGRALPAAEPPVIFNSWDELEGKLPDADSAPSHQKASVGRGRPDGRSDQAKPQSESGDVGGGKAVVPGRAERLPARAENDTGPVRGDRDRGQSGDVRTDTNDAAANAVVRDRVSGGTDKPAAARREPVARKEPPKDSGQALYRPSSNAASLDTLVPTNMAHATKAALDRVEKRHGDLDAFVSGRLGYDEDLGKYYSAEQIDALATAIDNVERGAGYIIGDQCVAGETQIFNPLTGLSERIDVLAAKSAPHAVLALTTEGFKPQAAVFTFKKGRADLFRVTLSDGRSIVVTKQHRFLTPRGWASLDDGVGCGTYLAVGQSEDTNSLSTRDAYARDALQKPQDCLDHCYEDHRPCGGQPRSAANIDPVVAQLQGDALERILASWRMGDLALSQEGSLPSRDDSRHSRKNWLQGASRDPVESEDHVSASDEQLMELTRQSAMQSAQSSTSDFEVGHPVQLYQHASFEAGLTGAAECPVCEGGNTEIEYESRERSQDPTTLRLGGTPPILHPNPTWSPVVSIDFVRHDDFYDMYVPGPENYLANGFINHNTGIGKGRFVAGMIRYAMRKGWTPVFVTEKPDLYGDMFRDMADIGLSKMLGREPRALMTNTGESVPLDEDALAWKQEADQARADGQPIPKRRGRFLVGGGKAAQEAAMRAIASGKPGHDIVFTTYDQMNTIKQQETDRRNFIRAIAPNSLIILDESHNAGGQGEKLFKKKHGTAPDRAEFVRDLVKNAAGVVYSSATFAKRPDVMDLYSRTDMGKAVDDPKMLPVLIQRGGVPMQQVVATMLSDAGQYMRRERSFEGVEYNVVPVPVDQGTYSQFSDAVRSVFEFDLAVEEMRGEFMQDVLDKMGASQAKDSGVGQASASTTAFSSLMHNIVNQMLLSIKADQVASRAIEARKAGEKPVIALASTMESFISDYAEDAGIMIGAPIDITFGDVLTKYLDRTLRITVKSAEGEKSHVQIPVNHLPARLQKMFAEAKALIREGDFSAMPVSPIDWIRHRVSKAGYSIAEVTGRKSMIDYGVGKAPKYIVRPKSEMGPSGKRSSIAAFNRGALDVLILNRSGSTGVSMHASAKFKDQSLRHMIIAQAEGNIDTHLQMLGRVHRTGQVRTPRYSQIAAEIPAEARPTAVLMKKMASLNANTTGARSSVFMADSVDFMNEYGDRVVANIVSDEPEINARLGSPLKENDKGLPTSEDAARRVTGRLVLLTPKEQTELLNRIQDEYKAEIERLDALGENALEAKTIDLKARQIETTPLKDRTGEGPFKDSAQIEKMSVKAQGRAMAPAEVVEEVSKFLRVPAPEGAEQASLAEFERRGRAWADQKIVEVSRRAREWIVEDVAEKSDDSKASVRTRHEDLLKRWMATARLTAPGGRVTLRMNDRQLQGIVLSVERSGKAKNPVALGAWRVKIAVPDSARTIDLPMSKLYPPDTTKSEDEPGIEIVPSQVPFSGLISQLEDARREGREDRFIVTGNILAGYDAVHGRGQIVNFTMEDGSLKPGILMSRDFLLDKFMTTRTVRFRSADQVAEFLDKVPMAEVRTSDKFVTMTLNRGRWLIETPAGRATGGRYYTDTRVRDALRGQEFQKYGGVMRADLDRASFLRVVEAIRVVGGIFETTGSQDQAQEIIRKSGPVEPALTSAPEKVSKTGMQAAIGASVSFDAVEVAILAGETYLVPQAHVAGQLQAIRPMTRMIPADTLVGVLERIEPYGEQTIDPKNQEARAVYRTPDGKTFGIVRKLETFRGIRAFAAPRSMLGGRPGLLLNTLFAPESLGKTASGVVWHEAVHVLRREVKISDVLFSRLLRHARSLRVFDMPFGDYLSVVGDPEAATSPNVTLRGAYRSLYRTRSDFVEVMNQEAVAHMLELWHHGAISDADMAPVRDILEDIRSGRVSGNTRAVGTGTEPAFAIGKPQSDQDILGYYSKLLRAAYGLKQEKGTPEQMLAQLKSVGVKDAEVKAARLDQVFNGKKSVTKDDIIAHLEKNRVVLSEKVYGGERFPRGIVAEPDGDILEGVAGEAKWKQYSLDPKNPTYRETVLHLPDNIAREEEAFVAKFLADKYDETEKTASEAQVDEAYMAAHNSKNLNATNFRSGHWSEPNVIAHVRTQVLQDSKGRKVFNIDELQSDWGQKLRDGGARDEAKIAELKRRLGGDTSRSLEVRAKEITKTGVPGASRSNDALTQLSVYIKQQSYIHEFDLAPFAPLVEAKTLVQRLGEVRLLEAELRTAEAATPGHPLVNTTDQWTTTALRRMIRQAVEAGADMISLTPGQVQAERFNLAKSVRSLEYDDVAKRLYVEEVSNRYGRTPLAINSDAELETHVGKAVAAKLLEQERGANGARGSGRKLVFDREEIIGGEGMKATYDVMYPRTLGRLLAKIDPAIKAETVNLRRADGHLIEEQMSPAQAIKQGHDRIPPLGFTAFPITEKVRDAVIGDGQPIFAISRLYHSTPAKFDRFQNEYTDEVGFHFGTKDQAHNRAYAMSNGNLWAYFTKWRDIPVEIEINNPATLSTDPGSFMPTALAKQLVKDGLASHELIMEVQRVQLGPDGSPDAAKAVVRDYLMSKGYDAIRYPNYFEGVGDFSYMTFGTGNVKDARTGDVLYAISGNIDNHFRAWMTWADSLPDTATVIGKVSDKSGKSYIIDRRSLNGSLTYRVLDGKKQVGSFYVRTGGAVTGSASVMNASVDKAYQRRGIASAAYDAIEADIAPTGWPLYPQGTFSLSADGRAFWEARDPAKLREMDEADRARFRIAGQVIKPAIDTKAQSDVVAAVSDAIEIVQRIAGSGLKVEFISAIPASRLSGAAYQAEEARRRGLASDSAGGFYRPQSLSAEALIGLSTNAPGFDLKTTAGHEAWHHVERALATRAELTLLRAPSELARMRRLAASELGLEPSDTILEAMPDYEIRAYAFQKYRRLREDGAGPVSGLHIGIRKFFDRLIRVFQNVANAVRGLGYDSFESIFERGRTGKMAARQAEPAATPAPPPLPEKIAGLIRETMEKFSNDNSDTSRDMATQVQAFMAQRLGQSDGESLTEGDAIGAYEMWASDAGIKPMSDQNLVAEIRRTGISTMLIAGQRRFIGLRLLDEAEQRPANPSEVREKDAWVLARDAALGYSLKQAIARQIERLKSVVGEKPDFARIGNLEALQQSVANDTAVDQEVYDNVLAMFERDVMGNVIPENRPTPANRSGGVMGRRIKRTLARASDLSDRARVKLQDADLPIRRIAVERVENETGAKVPLSLDTYIARTLFSGRAGEREVDFQRKKLQPLMDHLRKSKITQEQLGDYLYARHAQERNDFLAVMHDIGSEFFEARFNHDIVGASGMSTNEANQIIAEVRASGKQAEMDKAAAVVYEMVEESRKILLKAGLIDRETYDEWSRRYAHYVPLRGFEEGEEENPARMRSGRGSDIRGPESMQALGRRSKADNPLFYTVLQMSQSIVRSEKNRVNKTLYRAIEAYPNPAVWKTYKGELKKRVNPQTGLVENYWVRPPFVHDDAVFGLKKNGKQIWMELRHPTLARAMRGTSSEIQDTIVGRSMMSLARMYASLITTFSPEFGLDNFLRDVETGLVTALDVDGVSKDIAKKIAKDAFSLQSIRGVMAALRNEKGRTIFGTARAADETIIGTKRTAKTLEYAKRFDDYRLAGGKVSFMEYNDIEQIKKNIDTALKAGDAYRAIAGVFNYIQDMNTAVENGVRLSTYIAMVDAGVPKDRAALTAKELTVNFNRKGEWGPGIGALYLFFNASIQGTVRVATAMVRSRKVQIAVGAIFAAGAALDLINYLVSGDDDDGENRYEKMHRSQQWLFDKKIVFMNPFSDDHIMIPLFHGYNVPFLAGQEISRMLRGKSTPLAGAARVAGVTIDAFNPMGTNPLGANGSFWQFVAPTLLDPGVQVFENRTWYGGPIQPTKHDKRQPDSENSFGSAPSWAVDLSRAMNRASGGNVGRSGAIDISPEVIEHYVEFAGGGVAKFIGNAINTGDRLIKGEEWLPEKAPFIRRVYGKPTVESRRREFYEVWDDVDRAYYEVKELARKGFRDESNEARQKYAPELKVYGQMKGAKETIGNLRDQKDNIEDDAALTRDERKAKIAEIDAREKALIMRVLKSYRDAQKRKAVPVIEPSSEDEGED